MNRFLVPAVIGIGALLGTPRHAPPPINRDDVVRLEALPEPVQVDFPLPLDPEIEKEIDAHREKWYREALDALDESSLERLAAKDRLETIYRVLWLPSFHNPIAVRFFKSGQRVSVHTTRLSGKGGYEPGKVIETRTSELTKDQWERISSLAAKAQFWELGRLHGEPFSTGVEDGHSLLVEGVRDGTYHMVTRDNPDETSKFLELCREMLFLSGIDVRELWFEYCD
jgi:hypothetical protein